MKTMYKEDCLRQWFSNVSVHHQEGLLRYELLASTPSSSGEEKEFAFLTSSQLLLMCLVCRPYSKQH